MRTIDARTSPSGLTWFDTHFGPPPPTAVFDFDGVLASPVEDLVYKLPERHGERDALVAEASRYGIDAAVFETPYLRHLVLQARLDLDGTIPEPGPFLTLAREMTDASRPFFILTARSGKSAIRRVMSFLDHHRLDPQEVFFVGRVAKGRQLAMVRSTIPQERGVVYFEDTVRHARNSHQQDFSGFETVLVAWNSPPWHEAEVLASNVLPGWSTPSSIRTAA